ncbi:MAG: hypothetical protein ACK4HG_03820 [Agrobacterium albertimagni]
MVSWALIDDQEDAASFIATFQKYGVDVVHYKPIVGRQILLRDNVPVAGVLMDVDLSGEAGNLGTGLGFAQDIRASQKADALPDFPVIRFANPGPVAKNVRGDPTSDDLFDEYVFKIDLGTSPDEVVSKLRVASAIYDGFARLREKGDFSGEYSILENVIGLPAEYVEDWVHPGLAIRLLPSLENPIHVSAGVFLRTCVNAVGLLLDKATVAMRLGLSIESADDWNAVEEWLRPAQYIGVGSEIVERWWAPGVDQLWRSTTGNARPLAAMTISERTSAISERLKRTFTPLTMPRISPGDRPWRWCQLSLEETPPHHVPIDPSQALKMTMPVDQPAWVDPLMASKGAALRRRDDPRFGPHERSKL